MSEKLEKYILSNDCLVDTKQFKVTSNYGNLRQHHNMHSESILTETKTLKKWCFSKTKVPIYKKIAISLDKDFISNIDTCFNFVIRVDKILLKNYKNLDLVVKAKLLRIENFQTIFQA